MSLALLTPLLDFGSKLIDRFIPDPAQKAKANLELMQMQRDGDLQELSISMSAILAEAASADKWTSRARPSFMYVIYIVILFGLPMGIVSAFSAETATAIAMGFKAWLAAIPDSMWGLFGAGFLGYTASRTYEKAKGVSK